MKIDEENMPLRFTQRHLCWLKKGQTVERSAREEKKRKRKYGNFHSSLIPQPFGLFFFVLLCQCFGRDHSQAGRCNQVSSTGFR